VVAQGKTSRMTSAAGLTLACVSGFVALSYEIVWYRVYAVAMGSRSQAFGVLLAGYLAGIAIGSLVARLICGAETSRTRARLMLGCGLLSAALLGFLFVPTFAWLMTLSHAWLSSTALLALSAAGLGVVFPLIAHLWVTGEADVGARVSHIYLANILGSASGSLVTGLILTDHLAIPSLALALGLLGAACAGGVLVMSSRNRGAATAAGVVVLSVGAVMAGSTHGMFDDLYAKLIFKTRYRPDTHFAHVVENRAGVIAVTPDGAVYGAGLYDGVYNTDLRQDDRNLIRRAYALGALHAEPKDVLIIGLSSGSWAAVVANHPHVEHVTVVEINPGYVQLLPLYPAVEPLASDPKVRIEIDDGRRWLQRHPEAMFDMVIANTTYARRANATSLLSVGFLQLVRRHLKNRGVYYYNTTDENRVQRTGAAVFPFAWRLVNFLAVSDTPFAPDFDRFARQLAAYRLYGGPALDLERDDDRALLDRIVSETKGDLEDRDDILRRTSGLELVTDDNMGTEWTLPRAFWLR
jgi:predicted membrane-bound spermidine synthase